MQNCKVSKIEIHVRCVDASRRQPRTIGGLAADLIQLFTTCLLPPCTYKDRKAICYRAICPCLDERLHGPAPQLRRSEHCNLGDDSAFALLPCGIRRHQVGFGWHRRAKATKILTNPWAIYATHCSCIYKAGEALRLSHSAFPFRFLSLPSPARRCPVLIHLGPVTRRCSIA